MQLPGGRPSHENPVTGMGSGCCGWGKWLKPGCSWSDAWSLATSFDEEFGPSPWLLNGPLGTLFIWVGRFWNDEVPPKVLGCCCCCLCCCRNCWLKEDGNREPPSCCCCCCWFKAKESSCGRCWSKAEREFPVNGCWGLKEPKGCWERNGLIGCCCDCCRCACWNPLALESNVSLKERARSFPLLRNGRSCCLLLSGVNENDDDNCGRWLMNGSLINWLLNWLPANCDPPRPLLMLLWPGNRLLFNEDEDVPKGKRLAEDPNWLPDDEELSWNWPPGISNWLLPKKAEDPVPIPVPNPPLFCGVFPKLLDCCPKPKPPSWELPKPENCKLFGSLFKPVEPNCWASWLNGINGFCPSCWFWNPNWFWSRNGFWMPSWFWRPNWFFSDSWFWRPNWLFGCCCCCCKKPINANGFCDKPNWFCSANCWFWMPLPPNWFPSPNCAPISWFCSPIELNWLPWPTSPPFCWGKLPACWNKPFWAKLFWGNPVCCWNPFCGKPLCCWKLFCWKPLCWGKPFCCWNAALLNGNPIPDCWKGKPNWGCCCWKPKNWGEPSGRRPRFVLLLRVGGPSWSSSLKAWLAESVSNIMSTVILLIKDRQLVICWTY